MQIAKLLTAEQVLTVKAHYAQRDGKPLPEKPYKWSPKSVAGILERPEYTGCTVNFKTYSKSHKLKKRLHNAQENQRVFFQYPASHYRRTSLCAGIGIAGEQAPSCQAGRTARAVFRLTVVRRLWKQTAFRHRQNMTPQQDGYQCSRYKSNTGDCTMHFIRERKAETVCVAADFRCDGIVL